MTRGLGRVEASSEVRPAQRAAGERSRGFAFTLIELLAVILIIGLVAGLTLPKLSLGADRALLGEAEALASTFLFTRQRAVATGAAHRVIVDLDTAAYWVEGPLAAEDPFSPAPLPSPAPGQRHVQMSAPPSGPLGFQPLPGPFGRPHVLPETVLFESVETLAAGSLRSGQVEILFESDGTAEPAVLALTDEDANVYVLHLARLSDEVRIARE
jgi:prepilin-type N-terminal cleavage/methylation domain-containing protein